MHWAVCVTAWAHVDHEPLRRTAVSTATRRRKELGAVRAHCRICDAERELHLYESWTPRGPFGWSRDEATVSRVATCTSCGFSVRGVDPVEVRLP